MDDVTAFIVEAGVSAAAAKKAAASLQKKGFKTVDDVKYMKIGELADCNLPSNVETELALHIKKYKDGRPFKPPAAAASSEAKPADKKRKAAGPVEHTGQAAKKAAAAENSSGGRSSLRPPPPSGKDVTDVVISVNRSPVMVLWASVVAERIGYSWEEALSLGNAIAAVYARAKGESLGIYQKQPSRQAPENYSSVMELMGKVMPVQKTPQGLRGLNNKGIPIAPESTYNSLGEKFGTHIGDVYALMARLANAYPQGELSAGPLSYRLYERFRPDIPKGQEGWGAVGGLRLQTMVEMIKERDDATKAAQGGQGDNGK
ncbi:unnamed protein product [Vitrella brassicaformis CCMP3155]|uniref:Uncharacterized protein n=1 Tax=Vitrella brassicaformis (strain CCMP3155) TaxID=1169540 RepID=A0A0G4FH58_VITBC|nr:unnamed protein product [Vitrella brassicaformis CCMP3155]|eukprot:CEM12626.1 unnamed protein product [Vitrella brassicaformis CCMP3155]